MDGDIGVQTGHSPVFGILSPGSIVRIREVPGDNNPGDVVRAAIRDGFLSIADNRVSILASAAQLSTEVDATSARADMDTATADAGASAEESPDYRYARARLQAAGEQA
jgi:F-type H+-transporting ATPase subunit epsilon